MSKFKVGDRVRSLETAYDATKFCPYGVIHSVMNEGYTVTLGYEDGTTENLYHLFGEVVAADECNSEPIVHYTPDSTGKDYLARCEDTFSREEMIGAYRFTLGKYVDRMGKKTGEPVEKELAKIIDYATRAKAWLEGA